MSDFLKTYTSGLKSPEEKLLLSVEQLNDDLLHLMEQDVSVSQEGLLASIGSIFSTSYKTLSNMVGFLFNTNQTNVNLNESLVTQLHQGKTKMMKNYTYLIDRRVPIPHGMTSTYLVYLGHSRELVNCVKDVPLLVEQLRAGIGRVLSTEDGLRDSTLFTHDVFEKKKNEYQKLMSKLKVTRTGDDFNNTVPYGDVFRNNNEIYDCVVIARDLNKIINSIDRKKLIASIETTMQYIRELTQLAKDRGFSKQLVVKINQAVLSMAILVEGLSVVTFNQQMITAGLNGTLEEIVRLM